MYNISLVKLFYILNLGFRACLRQSNFWSGSGAVSFLSNNVFKSGENLNTLHDYFVCMQDGKDSEGFMKNIKKKVRDWGSRHQQTASTFKYSVLLLLSALTFAFIFAFFNLYHTDPDSARYMLSALVQSQAAIIAIVISLTLIAVQLTASAYSPRVIRIFRDNFDMWLLLGLYGGSIFYGLLVLKMIRGEDLSQIPLFGISLETHISYALFLGFFSIVMLFQYMLNIINLLNPANIIKRLSEGITKDKILKYIKSAKTSEEVETSTVEDPIQPIMDIIHGSIMKYDIETTRVGLEGVTERVIDAINSDDKRLQEASDDFCDHLRAVANLAARIGDEQPIVYVIRNLETFMKSKAEKKLEYASMQAIYSIGTVGTDVVKKGLEYATTEAAWCLGEVGKTALNKEFKDKDVADVAWYLEEIGKIAAKKELADKAMKVEVVYSLVTIGITAVEKQCGLTICQSTLSLAKLTILSEEIVEDAIQNYEAKLKEQDRDPFQKFKKLYEQKLEKLRAEK
ncbi:MAG: DUF2254 family protein [Halobacteriota archaeon]